jgi:hypothetical protein
MCVANVFVQASASRRPIGAQEVVAAGSPTVLQLRAAQTVLEALLKPCLAVLWYGVMVRNPSNRQAEESSADVIS